MNELRTLLRDADPLAREPGLSAADADAMRRRIVAAAGAQPSTAAMWPRPVFVAVTVAATIIIGIAMGARLSWPVARDAKPRASALARTRGPSDFAERRQLQFATPGGTRIIWVFDPEFNP